MLDDKVLPDGSGLRRLNGQTLLEPAAAATASTRSIASTSAVQLAQQTVAARSADGYNVSASVWTALACCWPWCWAACP